MRRILVTGAGGFVGGHLRRELESRGLEVLAADREPAAGGILLDVRDAEAVARVIADHAPDAIVHLAALSSAGRSFADPSAVFAVNGMGSLHLLEAVRDRRPECRFVSIGSADSYGPSDPDRPHDESAPLEPISPYGASKAWQDVLTGQYGRAYNLDTVRVRPFSHTGPGQRPTFVLASFAHQIAAIELERAAPVLRVGNLDVVRDYLDVRDVVRCYADIVQRSTPGAVWNVCSGIGHPLQGLLDAMLALARVPIRVERDPDRVRAADVPHLVGQPHKVRDQLGWQPKLTMEQTLTDLLDGARAEVAAMAAGETGS